MTAFETNGFNLIYFFTDTSEKSETPKKQEKEQSPDKPQTPSPFKDTPEESDKELSPLKDLSNVKKEILNNNKEETPDVKIDKDSVMGDEGLSDLESEGTQPEEVIILLLILCFFRFKLYTPGSSRYWYFLPYMEAREPSMRNSMPWFLLLLGGRYKINSP